MLLVVVVVVVLVVLGVEKKIWRITESLKMMSCSGTLR